jgi:CO/xanthine dehydrogenase Mo-binding subunit
MAAGSCLHDGSEALKVPGVVRVVEIPGTPPPSEFQPLGGVAVVATNTWAAIQGRNALKIQWDDGPNASYDSAAYKTALETATRNPAQGDAQRRRRRIRDETRRASRPGGVLHSPHDAGADGAAGRDGTNRRRALRSLGLRAGTAGHARSRLEAPWLSPGPREL